MHAQPDPDTTIGPGDLVRSHDFPNEFLSPAAPGLRPCYVEGIVEAVGHFTHPDHPGMGSCDRYKIRCTRRVFDGIECDEHDPFYYPPVNGTPTYGLHRTTFGVEKVREPTP